jgi:hypothetical protein
VTCSGTMAHVATRQRARRATQEGVWFFFSIKRVFGFTLPFATPQNVATP